jgi:hypothetical protein
LHFNITVTASGRRFIHSLTKEIRMTWASSSFGSSVQTDSTAAIRATTVSLYRHADGRFLVILSIAGSKDVVLFEDFPALVELLIRIAPLISAMHLEGFQEIVERYGTHALAGAVSSVSPESKGAAVSPEPD